MKIVEKENYDRLWQSFTERLEEGKKVSQAYPASTKQGKEQNHSKKGGGGVSIKTVTRNECACSIKLPDR